MLILTYIAVIASAVSGSLEARKNEMDIEGATTIALVTAFGGGTIRDVLLGHYPLVWVQNPSYLALTAIAAFITILIARHVHRLNVAFLVLDAIALVVFTMAGCDVAWQMNASLPIVIVAGMITGCAGGVLRDILCNDVPLLFRSELYASVSVVTGLFYATAFGLKLNDELWTALTFVLGITFRLLAIRYKWEMPKFVFGEEKAENAKQVLQNWERLKAKERQEKGKVEAGLLDGIAPALPALAPAWGWAWAATLGVAWVLKLLGDRRYW